MFILFFLNDLISGLYKIIKSKLYIVLILSFILLFTYKSNLAINLVQSLVINFTFFIIFIYDGLLVILHYFFYVIIHNLLPFLFFALSVLIVYGISYCYIFIIHLVSFYGALIEMLVYITEVLFIEIKYLLFNGFSINNYNYYLNSSLNFFEYLYSCINIQFLVDNIYYCIVKFFSYSFHFLLMLSYYLWFLFKIIITLDFIQPIIISLCYIYHYIYNFLEAFCWYSLNFIKLLIISLIQFITFILRVIAPADHGGSPIKPFPDSTMLINEVSGYKLNYVPDIYRNFFMFLEKTLYIHVDIFNFISFIYKNISLMLSYQFLVEQFNFLTYILIDLSQFSYYDLYIYTINTYISYIYIYVNISHLYVYLVCIGLFSSWFIFKGWMDIQLERISFLGIIDFIVNLIRFLKNFIFKYKILFFVIFAFILFFVYLFTFIII